MDDRKSDSPLTVIGVLLGLVGTGAGIWSQIDKRLQDRQIEELKAEISQKAEARSERVAERDYSFKVTEKVIDALASQSADKQKVAAILVDTLNEGDVKLQLRTALIAVSPKSPEFQRELQTTVKKERVFDDAQAATAVAARGNGQVRVDVFWCEGDGEQAHKERAQQLHDQAVASRKFGTVRLRALPVSVNRRPGYGIVSDLIRHEFAERNAANALRALAAGKGFELQQISYQTQDYVSAFACAPSGLA